MKLYYSKSACSLAVRIVINELKLPCDYEAVDLRAKKTESGIDFLKINPKGAVPTLEIGSNEVLTENCVIQQYLADSNPAGNLLAPTSDFSRYRTLEVLNFITTDIHKGFSPLFNPKVPAEVKDEVFKPILKSKFDYINRFLADKTYLMGDHFTLPDAYLFVMLFWSRSMKINLDDNENLLKYYELLRQRPSIKQSIQEEGISLT